MAGLEKVVRDGVAFIDEVIAREGYTGADCAIWEFFQQLKDALKSVGKTQNRFSDSEKEEIKNWVKEGLTGAEMARRLNVRVSSIYYQINQFKKGDKQNAVE